MDGTLLAAVLASAAAIVSGVLSWHASRRRDSGQYSLSERAAFTQEQIEFRQELRDEVDRLRTQVEGLSADNARMRQILDLLEDEIDAYRVQLREHGITLPTRRPYYRYPNDQRGPDEPRGVNDPRRAQDARRPDDPRWVHDERRPSDRKRPEDAPRHDDRRDAE